MNNLKFGVNYVPSKKWNYSWTDFNISDIREDLQAITKLDVDHIRIHLSWNYFQPNINYVSEQMLENLVKILDVAKENNLNVEVTVLDGWLCGYIYLPAWIKDNNIFTNREIIDAQKYLFSVLAETIGRHDAFMGFDLGNELCVLNHWQSKVTQEEADSWNKEMLEHIEKCAPNKFHVNGVDHAPWFADFSFSREALSNTGSVTSIHSWILFTGAMERYKPLEIGCTNLIEYCVEFAKAYSNDVNRLVWIEEFGINKGWIDEVDYNTFMDKTFESIMSCTNVWGLTWWCSHDIDRKYKGFDPLEYDMGLIDINNNLKPNGLKFKELVNKYKNQNNNMASHMQNRALALVFPDNYFTEQMETLKSIEKVGWSFGEYFMKLLTDGKKPTIVLESKVKDIQYLKSRNIKQCIYMKDIQL